METKLTLEQAINRLDRIFDNDLKLKADLNKMKSQIEALNKQLQSNDVLKSELKLTIQELLNTESK